MSAIKKLFGSQKFKALLYLVFGAWAFYLGRYHSLYGLGASVVFAVFIFNLFAGAVSMFVFKTNASSRGLNITLNIDYLDNYTIELYDLKGVNLKEIFSGTLDLGDSNIFYSTDNLSSGVYLIKISSNSGNNKMMKFIKK